MQAVKRRSPPMSVALLAEGVDRNMGENDTGPWAQTVALLAEGVDRNPDDGLAQIKAARRPPRGGRG